jgi:signal transduction histidine kinase/CheY-like chemotaxis protein
MAAADTTDGSFMTRNRGVIDLAVAVSGILGTALLFYIDSVSPRGQLDGIGYPVVIIVAARFGRPALFGWTALCTLLIVVAQFLVPDTGISIGGEIANRVVGISTIWMIAWLMGRRLGDEAANTARERVLHDQQVALSRIVRDVLPMERPLGERVRVLTEIAAAAMDVDAVSIVRFFEGGQLVRTVDLYERAENRHSVSDDFRGPRVGSVVEELRKDGVSVMNDLPTGSLSSERRALFERVGIRSSLSAAVFIQNELTGQVFFANRAPRVWSEQEIAFAKVLGSVATSLFATDLNQQTLSALDEVREGIYVEDNLGAIAYANRAAVELASQSLSVPDREVVPWHLLPFPKAPSRLMEEKDLHEIRQGELDLEIARSKLPNGGLIARVNDVTERNRDHRRREQLHLRLREAEKLEAIGRLAGGVAHDFNNIIGAIMGFASFLQQDLPEGSEQNGFAKRILGASERAKELIEQILTFARVRSTDEDAADLNAVAEQTIEIFKVTLPQNIRLELARSAAPLMVASSAARLSQLVLNLCINAREAVGDKDGRIALAFEEMPHDEPAFAAESREGEVTIGTFDPLQRYARFRVSDTGAGIDAKVLSQIFEPFFTTKGRTRGTGLGLAVAHGVIVSCGGCARVASRPGEGTEFTIYLPMSAAAPKAPRKRAVMPARQGAGERILVVDDEPDMVDSLVIGLERLGYRTVGIGDPLDALRTFREDPRAFDVVVTDLVMPSLRGTELVQQIKAIRPDIRTILCTAYSDGLGAAEIESEFVDAFFRKPVELATLAGCIQAFRAEADSAT